MKMGTIRSPCPYDAAARHALQSVILRRPAILHYAFDSGRADQSGDRRDVPQGDICFVKAFRPR